MASLIALGAINKATGVYELPKFACKGSKYKCPECEKDVILRKGVVRKAHFAHHATTDPCNHYNHPGESQIHKHAKEMTKYILEHNFNVSIDVCCSSCKSVTSQPIPKKTESASVVVEYSFDMALSMKHTRGGRKTADVALVNSGTIVCLFEICNAHKTKEGDRPDPWYELDAVKLIEVVERATGDEIKLMCERTRVCESCIDKKFIQLNSKSTLWLTEHPVEFEWYVRYVLGQRVFAPMEDQEHLRFDYDAQDSEGMEYNSKIIELFDKHFDERCVTIDSHKGAISYSISETPLLPDDSMHRSCDNNEITTNCSLESTVPIIMMILSEFK